MGSQVSDAAGLLDLWERASSLGPIERAIALAEAGGGDARALLDQPYGRAGLSILDLRTSLFGPELEATATCPHCDGRVEFTVNAEWLRAHDTPSIPDADHRPPTVADLLAASISGDPYGELRRRCLGTDDLPAAHVALLDDALAAADPLAEVLVNLNCPDCGTSFVSDLDLAAFAWAEVDARARHLLHEVDVLARAYGWTEPEVLDLTESRRAAYLRIATGGPA
jgi:hypothetical protein